MTIRRLFSFLLTVFLYICAGAEATEESLQIIITRGQQTYSIGVDEFDHFPFVSGDSLAIYPEKFARGLLKTPDGHRHVMTSFGTAIRIPQTMIFEPYGPYQIPEHLCILTGAGASTLDSFGKAHVANYIKYMGLWPEMTFLEIGCGIGRDVFQLLPIIGKNGKYIGIDVTRDSIAWLKKIVSLYHPNFSFFHFDAWHQLYNPLGLKTSCDFTLPAADQTVDRIALGSVFTHLFEDEIVHYLKEIKRVLAPKGLVYATFFLYDERLIVASRNKSNTPFNLRFEYSYGQGCYVNDPVYTTGAVAYTYDALLRMFQKAGLRLAIPLLYGAWSGARSDAVDGQEVAILTHDELP